MSDAVEAQVIETGELVITKMQPGTAIEANIEALETRIAEIVADYTGLVVTPEYLSQAKKDRAYLNSLSKSLNQRRIEVKQLYMAPVVAFEERIKRLDAPLKEASASIDTQVKAFEEKEKDDKRAALVNHYEEYAPLLVESVPFERIEDPKWINKSVQLGTAIHELEEKVGKIAADYETLKGLQLPYEEDAAAELFTSLDLSRAIARSKELQDRADAAKRLADERAAMEAARAPEPTPEPAPEPVTAPVGKSPAPETRTFTFTVDCTLEQRQEIVNAIRALGLHGKVAEV